MYKESKINPPLGPVFRRCCVPNPPSHWNACSGWHWSLTVMKASFSLVFFQCIGWYMLFCFPPAAAFLPSRQRSLKLHKKKTLMGGPHASRLHLEPVANHTNWFLWWVHRRPHLYFLHVLQVVNGSQLRWIQETLIQFVFPGLLWKVLNWGFEDQPDLEHYLTGCAQSLLNMFLSSVKGKAQIKVPPRSLQIKSSQDSNSGKTNFR